MPHSNIDPKTRTRAKRLRRETPIGSYIADFSWLSARIIIEVDGDSHEPDHGRRHDQSRDDFPKAEGFTVLRFDNVQVTGGPDYVFETVKRLLPHSQEAPSR